jgi:hypothetical protein
VFAFWILGTTAKQLIFRRDVNSDSCPKWMKNRVGPGMDIHIPGIDSRIEDRKQEYFNIEEVTSRCGK